MNGCPARSRRVSAPSMHHFTGRYRAVVVGSYKDQFGGSDVDSFTLFLEGYGETSWYRVNQLTLIEAGRSDLLEEWRKAHDAQNALHSTRAWIFANAPMMHDYLYELTGASLETLGRDAGINDMAGNRGEGVIWDYNVGLVLHIAAPFLKTGDETGWLALCATKPIRFVRRTP